MSDPGRRGGEEERRRGREEERKRGGEVPLKKHLCPNIFIIRSYNLFLRQSPYIIDEIQSI